MYNLMGKDETGEFSKEFLAELFETEEDLERYNDFGNIVREEKLDLPLWSELQEITKKKKLWGFVLLKILTMYI